MTLPNFLVIGAQKSGTTWLHEFLNSRPDVFVPNKKELMFFDVKSRFDEMGLNGYGAHFDSAGPEAAVGEVTPAYLWSSMDYADWGAPSQFREGIPARVCDLLGADLRIIALLRNPIDRALSAFGHHRKMGRVPDSGRLSAHWHRFGIVHMGFYAAHLAQWSRFFPAERFFVTTYERFFEEPNQRVALLEFLDAEPDRADELSKVRVYAGSGFTRDASGAFDATGAQIASGDELAKLREVFRTDVESLRTEWAIDLSAWRQDFPGAGDSSGGS